MGPHPAVAAIRLAVRKILREIQEQHYPDSPGGSAAPPSPAPSPPRAARSPRPPQRPHRPRRRTGPATAVHALPRPAPVGDVDPEHAKRRTPRPRPPADAPLVLVAVSGGADSMALAAATAFEAARLGIRAGGVTVDHGLQEGSTARALEVANRLRALGLDPVDALGVRVGRRGGPESAARDARYAALDAAAEKYGARAVLLGHTRDDQAETVLLGLARGSGTRSLSGMPAATGRYRRPFLDLDRSVTRRACAVLDLPVWDDPHNTDPAYTRSRVRSEVLPVLEKHLGGGVVDALARTARLFRDDADALDQWAARAECEAAGEGGLSVETLGALPPAVRRRVLRRAAISAGSPAGDLFARHIETIDELITRWHGQGPLHLPGGVEARRRCGRLFFGRSAG
ncbi:tRNA lysidine(34) synthetase TilS [Phaeacidiphilus oryzae]|uniref:tRNA lysidine(34) synthetase TilS n=1 Tax=Phaeacidiphilus oryzae TaxID=348818 RepID=UPI000560201A|nr:tRNA lysidine(34) synthetase TilS [Phaeacidiphilus oryzae]